MKTLTLVAALLLGTTIAASAATTGCETRKAENGNWLVYVTPENCAAVTRDSRDPIVVADDEPEGPGDDGGNGGGDSGGDPEPETPEGDDKGNASANNGKGGNYTHTQHADNGKGNGKGRRG